MKEERFLKAPFHYFGSKARAAGLIWRLLGEDVPLYFEPFMGSLSVLLARPRSEAAIVKTKEIVNDRDGLLVNFWRAVRFDPEQTAYYASWPISHVDLVARRMAIREWIQNDAQLERMMVDETFCDPKIAGFWVYAQVLSIGNAASDLKAPWWRNKEKTKLEKCGNGDGVSITIPHTTSLQGIVSISARHNPLQDGTYTQDPLINPNVLRWFTFLQQRLRHVIILCDDWSKITSLAVRNAQYEANATKPIGIFLDPPYDRTKTFSVEPYYDYSRSVYADVLDWCKTYGTTPTLRIVLAAYEDEEHVVLLQNGWRVYEWYRNGAATNGRARSAKTRTMREKERLYASPACCIPEPALELALN